MVNTTLPNIDKEGKINTTKELLHCPCCGDSNIMLDKYDIEYNHVYTTVQCEKCNTRWVEDYVFNSAYLLD